MLSEQFSGVKYLCATTVHLQNFPSCKIENLSPIKQELPNLTSTHPPGIHHFGI